MAKGDKKKVESAVNTAVSNSQGSLDNLTNGMLYPTAQNMYNNYNTASNQNFNDYNNIMQQYQNFQPTNYSAQLGNLFTPYTAETVDYSTPEGMMQAMNQFAGMAQNGGYDQNAQRDIRARGISPIRSVYANAQNEMERQKNLQGGYSPNFNAASTKMNSQLAQQIADATQNVNAQLADAIQQGRLAGTQGLGTLSSQDASMGLQAKLANQAALNNASQFNAGNSAQYGLQGILAQIQADQDRLNSINGQASLYSATPGLTNMYGNQLLNANSQLLQGQQQQNQVGQMGIQGAMGAAQVPGNWQQAMNNISSGLGIGQQVGNMLGGFGLGLPGQTQLGQSNPNTYATPQGGFNDLLRPNYGNPFSSTPINLGGGTQSGGTPLMSAYR